MIECFIPLVVLFTKLQNDYNFFNMQFTLGDVAQIMGVLLVGLAAWVALQKAFVKLQTKSEEKIKNLDKRSDELNALLHEMRLKISAYESYAQAENSKLWNKLIKLETNQVKHNVLLEENLKRLTTILENHNQTINSLKSEVSTKFTNYDNNINEFYKIYDLKKKSDD